MDNTYKFGFIGEMGSGKTTAVGLIKLVLQSIFGVENTYSYVLKFATPIYAAVNSLGIEGEKPRQFMQKYGTLCREEFGDDVFEKAFEKDYFNLIQELPLPINPMKRAFVCDDVRFIGEAQLLRDLGFKLIRVEAERGVRQERIGITFKNETHRSELELKQIVPDIVITNNRPIEYLKNEIEKLIINY